jgi:hypothetical protein
VGPTPFLDALLTAFSAAPLLRDLHLTLKEFGGHKLGSVSKEGLELEETDDEKTAREEEAKSYEDICKVIKDVLGDKVEKVIVSNRISDSPCVLVLLVSMVGHRIWWVLASACRLEHQRLITRATRNVL